MSSRHLRRIQKSKTTIESENESEPDAPARQNIFAFLSEDEIPEPSQPSSSSAESEEDSMSKESSKCKYIRSKSKDEAESETDAFDTLFAERMNFSEENPTQNWADINMSAFDEPKELRERLGSVVGQMRRPQGRIIAPRKSWPKVPASALGFTLVRDGDHNYHVVASEGYLERFSHLQALINVADVGAISLFIQRHPECVEALIIMSDIVRQHSVADAAAMVELALYLVEKTLPCDFIWQTVSLPYSQYIDNRTIHLTLFRHCQFLLRRGSWKAALETAKLLYNVDHSDPLCSIFFIDYILLYTRDSETHDKVFKQLGDNFRYPFLEMSNSLLHNRKIYACQEAIDIYNKNAFEKESYNHSIFKVYFGRSLPHYKSVSLISKEDSLKDMCVDGMLSVYRHAILSDIPSLHIAYPSSTTTTLDPFPPTTDGLDYPKLKSNSIWNSVFQRLF